MNPERWRRIEELLDAALDLSPGERAAFLQRECRDDPDLLRDVSSIIAAGERDDSVLEGSAVRVAAPMLVDESIQLPPPERVGQYRIERQIGEGGMGTVYLAHRDDGEFDQRVALKLVRRGLHLDARIVRRFRDERQILAALNHPGIARLLDGGLTSDGLPFFAMEYVDGQPIDAFCNAHNWSVEQRLELFVRVCDALAHAHGKQIVHRDIKPSNILVTETGAPHLLDFGIAKLLAPDTGDPFQPLTRHSERLLTPEYASPEQIRGEQVDVASDVYCLGVLLYELLTGQRPFRRLARSAHDLERAILDAEPTRPSEAVDREPLRRRLKGDLDTIVLTAMRKEARRRYPSAAEMAEDIRRHLAGRPIAARRADPVYRLRRWTRRHRLALGLGAAAAALTAVVASIAERATIPQRYVVGAATRIPVDPELALDAEISPDGKRLAFVAGSGASMHLFVRDLSTGRVTPLGNDVPGYQRLPRWAPDGTHMAVMAESRIYDVQLDGGYKLLAAPDSGATFVAFPAWSPDAKSIAYVQDASILIRDFASGATRRLTGVPHTPHSLRWSPNGKLLALVSGNVEFTAGTYPWVSVLNLGNAGQSSIWVMSVQGGDTARVSDAVGRSLNVAPVWTPDSHALLYISNRDGSRDVYRADIDERGRRIGEPFRLTTGLLPHTISLSDDGQTIGFSVFRLIANIWSVTPKAAGQGNEPLPLTRGTQSVEGISLSADGRTLAFDSDRNGNHDIYTIPSRGGEPRQLTSDPLDEFMPSWSPDGREIAYHAFSGRGGAREVRVVSADGGKGSAVTQRPINQRQPAWSSDGRALAFDAGSNAAGDVYVVERDSLGTWGAARIVAANGGAASWSPDGQRILYVRADGIFVTARAGGEPHQVFRVDSGDHLRLGNAQWSPDGRRVFFKRFDGEGRTSFWSIPADGGMPRLEVQLNRELRSHRSEFATDGSRFYFTLTERASELWTAELRTTR